MPEHCQWDWIGRQRPVVWGLVGPGEQQERAGLVSEHSGRQDSRAKGLGSIQA